MNRFLRHASATLAVLLLLPILPGAPSLHAQVLTGRVTDATSAAPISAVLVELLDADSAQVAAALSGPDGRYAVQPALGGTFTVRVRRLGYATRHFGPMSVTDLHPFDIQLGAEPVRLQGLLATARPVCADGPGVGPETQRLWELVTGALDVARVAQELDAYRFDMHTYVRDRTLDGRHVLLEGAGRSRESGAFIAMPIETLEDQGYVEVHRGAALSWYMPDPEVLVSDHFLKTHCFRVETSDDPTVVGLGFDPTPDRRRDRPDADRDPYRDLFGREVVEVSGVLWVDRATGALREMTYRYVGVRDQQIDGLAGGYARFEQLAGGLWIVRQWVLKMPNLGVVDGDLVPESRREVGGFVVDAHDRAVEVDLGDPDAPTRTSAMAAESGGDLIGRLSDAGVPIPLDDAVVRLSGSPWAARTDASGAFAFRGVPPGPYLVTWWAPQLDSLGLPARGVDVTVSDGLEKSLVLQGPSLDFAVDHLCRGMAVQPGLGILRVLTDPAAIRPGSGSAGSRVSMRARPVELRSAEAAVPLERVTVSREGVATFCSVPTGVPLEVGFPGDESRTAVTLTPHEIRAVSLVPGAPDGQ